MFFAHKFVNEPWNLKRFQVVGAQIQEGSTIWDQAMWTAALRVAREINQVENSHDI